MKRLTRLWAVLTGVMLVAVACGTDGGTPTTAPQAGDTTTTSAPGSACSPGQVDGDLLFYNWSEYIDPELITDFETEFGVSVVQDFYDSNEAMMARLQTGASYDIVVPSDYAVGIMITDNLLAPIQRDAVPNLANLDPLFADPSYDPGGVYSVAYQWGTTGLGVNLNVVGEDFDPSWALVFDPELTSQYPGGFSLLNDPRETIGAALKYLGYSLNSTSLDELQQASDLIRSQRGDLTAFDSDRYASNLVNGETAVAHGYSGGFFSAFDDTDDPDGWEYVVPKEGGTLWIDNMAVPTTAQHPCTAHTFINFILDAENGAALTNWNFYASPNLAAEGFIDPDILEDPAIYPDDEIMERLEVIVDTGDFEINYEDALSNARG